MLGINQLSTILVITTLFMSVVQLNILLAISKRRSISFLTFWLQTYITLFSSNILVIAGSCTMSILFILRVHKSYRWSDALIPSIPWPVAEKEFGSLFEDTTLLITSYCIHTVDTGALCALYYKTICKAYVSVMDLGLPFFAMLHARKGHRNWLHSSCQMIALGIARVLITYSAGIQTADYIEYGLLWNSYITLGLAVGTLGYIERYLTSKGKCYYIMSAVVINSVASRFMCSTGRGYNHLFDSNAGTFPSVFLVGKFIGNISGVLSTLTGYVPLMLVARHTPRTAVASCLRFSLAAMIATLQQANSRLNTAGSGAVAILILDLCRLVFAGILRICPTIGHILGTIYGGHSMARSGMLVFLVANLLTGLYNIVWGTLEDQFGPLPTITRVLFTLLFDMLYFTTLSFLPLLKERISEHVVLVSLRGDNNPIITTSNRQ